MFASEGNYFEGDKFEQVASINIMLLLQQSCLLLIIRHIQGIPGGMCETSEECYLC